MGKWVIFDLDGTIANIETRLEIARGHGSKVDYSILFDGGLIHLDKPNNEVIDLLKNFKLFGCKVFILSGRADSTIVETKEWLKKYDVPFDKLILKQSRKTYIKSNKWKEQELNRFRMNGDDQGIYPQIIFSIDDNDENIAMFESNDIPTLNPDYLYKYQYLNKIK